MGKYFKVVPGRSVNNLQAFDEIYMLNDDGTPWTPDNPTDLAGLVATDGPVRTALNTAIALQAPVFKPPTSSLPGSRRPLNLRAGTKSFTVADTQHNAFPGMAVCKDGSLLVVWRSAPQHDPTPTAGVIKARKYAANGTPLTAAYTVLSDPLDLRDPMLTVLDNGEILMQYFKHDGTATTIAGVWVAKSSDNGATFQVVSKVPFTWDTLIACAGKVVVAPNGDWLVAAYGRTSATFQNIRLMRSTNKGVSWSGEITVAEGQAESRNYMEPVLGIRPDGSLMCLIRVADSGGANPAIYSTTSTDSGLTWAAETLIVAGVGGRPAWTGLASGGILLVNRLVNSGNVMQFRTSWDNGVTWTAATQIGKTPLSQGTYAQPVEIAPGLVAVAWGIEDIAASSSTVSWGYVADGSGWSPAGDDFNAVAAAYPVDVALADTFQRADNTVLGAAETGQAWTVVSGGIGIASNVAQQNNGAGTSIVTADSGVSDGAIDCLWRWTATGSGNGIILRRVDATNYLFVAVESVGNNLKLYKYDGGALSTLGSVVSQGLAAETWHAIRVTVRGARIEFWVNGTRRISYTMTSAELTKYGQSTMIGLRATLDGCKFSNLTVRQGFTDEAAVTADQPSVFVSADSIGNITAAMNRIGVPGVGYPLSWQFDPAANEQADLVTSAIPASWAMFDVVLWWAATNADTGGVVWSVQRNYLAAGSLTNTGATSANLAAVPGPGVAGQAIATTAFSKVARGSGPLQIRITRLATDAADTYTADAALIGVQFIRVA